MVGQMLDQSLNKICCTHRALSTPLASRAASSSSTLITWQQQQQQQHKGWQQRSSSSSRSVATANSKCTGACEMGMQSSLHTPTAAEAVQRQASTS
jgi:hypothetical protein